MKNRTMSLASSIAFSFLVLTLNGAQTHAQVPRAQDGKPSGSIKAENKVRLPPTVKDLFVPDLRLRGSESVEAKTTLPKSYHRVTFLFQNWDKLPAEMLEPTKTPPSLPPNPCTQVKMSSRLFAVLVAENKKIMACTELRPTEDFYFMLDKEKPMPDFVYVKLVDRQTGKSYKSTLVSPSSGVTK